MPAFARLRSFWPASALLAGLLLLGAAPARTADDVLFADFESTGYGAWKAEGNAFGPGPSEGTLPGQMEVTGFVGRRLVNSHHGGDGPKGRLTSPPFPVRHRFISFHIGGGGHAGKTCLNLIVGGKVVRTATGRNTAPGGSERLERDGWDVGELRGKTAHLEIVDDASGGWGHINVDHIEFTDDKPPMTPPLRSDVTRTIPRVGRWLNFPVRNGAPKRRVTVQIGGRVVREAEIPLADGKPDWWAPMETDAWRGQPAVVTVDRLPEGSRALEEVTTGDQVAGHESLYREPLRPQFHFSARRGWLNDPNGMAFHDGEYHLFFQHSPFTWGSDVKYWGHAVSRDLVHWTEVEEALYPDRFGAMWSGSGVVDAENTSGFGRNGKAPLVLLYTAAGEPFVQCLAYSTDGRSVTKFDGNPVVPNITAGNRDPKVLWHAPTRRWVQVLYVEKDRRHTVHFFTSPDLKTWTLASVTEGKSGTSYLYECPDLFELPVDGDPARKKWVLTGADTWYQVGEFDGQRFTPETPPLPGHRGRGFYAPQTFSDVPDGRRIQIGWWQTETPGMPFNQSMSLPLDLRLVSTPEGPRLTYAPVPELESLRAKAHRLGAVKVAPDAGRDPLASIQGELFEVRAEFTPAEGGEVTFRVRGVPVVYDAGKQELRVNGHAAPAPPLREGKQTLTIFADRTGLEVFAGDGRAFVPMPVNLKPEDRSLSVTAQGAPAEFTRLDVYELRSAWR